MIRKKKKNKGMRGYKTHGWGSKKKHRGSGNRGGFGMAGTGKRADQKKPSVLKEYGNKYFGKRGFVRHNGSICEASKAINLEKINMMKESEIDLSKLGYCKLLGKGFADRKLTIIAKSASRGAIEKVKKAGGEVIIK